MSDPIKVEEVETVQAPPRAKVSDAVEPAVASAAEGARQRDYLAGFLAQQPAGGEAPHEPGGALYEGVIDALKEIYDPEIPVNIYDLGLIYAVEVTDAGQATVTMTLTTPNCPVAESMPGEVEMRVAAVPGIAFADVNLVWDPPWDPQKMSDDAKLELGML
ncbi:SUF system Fe-S cluster assembly protein [Sphingomonas yunnanensis]|uniref:SUF system Fe-S cluster assembly protein n=1 Tax=Sphingomonas yunnanensis TaxID=310400 RepID=UPI001CA68CC3|nr:SUF system Fe-S cluster assembly protein [Sphingomonas yunnanensis]MBY9062647.1 SUF system Fe-S cluster assembly protein [Sphingomonas yunnanensis]